MSVSTWQNKYLLQQQEVVVFEECLNGTNERQICKEDVQRALVFCPFFPWIVNFCCCRCIFITQQFLQFFAVWANSKFLLGSKCLCMFTLSFHFCHLKQIWSSVSVYVFFYGACNAAEVEFWLLFLFSRAVFLTVRGEICCHTECKPKHLADASVFFFGFQFVYSPWVIIHDNQYSSYINSSS